MPHGDAVRRAHSEEFARLIEGVVPLPGARDPLVALSRTRGVVLASSADPKHHIEMLGARELIVEWTTAGDVHQTKLSPDIVAVALDTLRGGPAVRSGTAHERAARSLQQEFSPGGRSRG